MTTQTIGPRAPVFTPSGNSRLDSMFSFNPDGSYKPATTFDPYGNDWTWEQVTQSDQGAPTGWSNAEETRRQAIDNAYYSLQSSQGKNTSFADPSSPPSTLGADVMSSLAAYGNWMDKSAGNDIVSAIIDPASGHIMVNSSNGGDGHNPIFIYDQSGNYLGQQVGSKQFGALKGVSMVAGAALGGLAAAGMLGADAAAAGAAGAAGAGAGAGSGALGAGAAGLGAGGITGADLAAGAGLGAGAAGASFGGIGAGAAGSGFGIGTLGELGIGGASTFGSAGIGGLAGAGAALDAAGAGAGGAGAGAGGAGAGAGGAAGGALQGVPPPANPNVGGGLPSLGSLGNLGSLATAAGGLLGSQGTSTSTTAGKTLPDFLQGPVVGDLIPRTQGLLNTQMPQAAQAGQQMMTAGTSLLNQPVAGNGFTSGAVKLNAPTTGTNPYLQQAMDSLGNTNGILLAKGLQNIRGQSVGVGGLGGSRQGVAEAGAIDSATKNLLDAGTNLYYNAYNNDQNRALQQYQSDQSYYTNQRSQDLTGSGIGAGLLSQGLTTPWLPIQGATGAFSPFTGFGTSTTTANSGAGLSGALGGALGAAQLSKNLGLFGSAV